MELRSRGRRTPPELIPIQVGTPQCALPDDETILAEAKTMYMEVKYGDILVWYTEKRWIGSTWPHQPMLCLSNQDTELCRALWLTYRAWRNQERLRETQSMESIATVHRFASEDALRRTLKRSLEDQSWHCELEPLTRYGRADIRATRADRSALIEAKLVTDGNTLKVALGQLLAYGLAEPHHELWLAVPTAVSQKFVILFQHYNIAIVEVPCPNPME